MIQIINKNLLLNLFLFAATIFSLFNWFWNKMKLACHLVIKNAISARNCLIAVAAFIFSTPIEPRRINGLVKPHKPATAISNTEVQNLMNKWTKQNLFTHSNWSACWLWISHYTTASWSQINIFSVVLPLFHLNWLLSIK